MNAAPDRSRLFGPPPAAGSTGVLLATRSAMMAMGFGCLFREQPHIRLVGVTSTPTQAQAVWQQHRPQLVLMDAEFLRALDPAHWQSLPPARIALLWRFSHRGAQVFPGLERACGLLRHCAEQGEAVSVVRTMLHCARPHASTACDDCWLQGLKRPLELPLSPREQRVIELIGLGHTNQSIALALGLSVKTVESYREEIKRKLGLADAAALVKAALLWRLGEDPAALPGPASSSPPAA